MEKQTLIFYKSLDKELVMEEQMREKEFKRESLVANQEPRVSYLKTQVCRRNRSL